ncbi:serine hydrolase FSH [Xylaria sp. FL0064]|nr:serine hydrolase FSH [Xylaria sp. FL0064]
MVDKHNFKVLCLHGIGTNSDILEAQTAPLRYALGPAYSFTFVDGAHPWPAAPGIEALFGTAQATHCFNYYDGTVAGAEAAVRDLAAYLVDSGPFDCVLGFSLGAALIATLLLAEDGEPELRRAQEMIIKGVVLICGIRPMDWGALVKGQLRALAAEDVPAERKIRVPTVHAWSREDNDYPGHSEALVQMCEERKRTEVLHGAGHDVPRKVDDVAKLVATVKTVVETN